MELVQGETLAERIHRGPLPIPEALVIARQTAEALEAAHGKAIIHRDLKPANVKITAEGLVKVLDFGLAKALAIDALSLELTEAPTLTAQGTRDGAILGTAPYMSPEQARGQPVDKRTDIWSFGCVLYELLTGTRAFRGETLPDTLAAILDREPAWQQLPAKTPPDVRRLLWRCLEKDTAARYHSGAELLADVAACQAQLAAQTMALTAILKRPAIVAVAVSCVILVLTAGAWWWVRTARASWARDEAIPQIERLVVEDEYLAAYDLAQQAEAYLRDDGSLRALWPQFATTASLITAPDGADIFFRTYRSRDRDWRYLGRSPLNNVRLPRGTFRWRIEKTGFATLEVATGSLRGTAGPTASLYSSFFPPLTQSTQLPRDMVFVPRFDTRGFLGLTGLNSPNHNAGLRLSDPLGSFVIDKYEVTNRQFKEFVDAGGYEKPQYWREPFVKAGRSLSWNEAMTELHDSTGRPGPATWELGDYPRGQDGYPVGGVSWYEAAAYAEFRGKRLPTLYHWSQAGLFAWDSSLWSTIVAASNFGGKGPAVVGTSTAIGPFGTYDMAGNVREWCWNADDERRYILGGGWSDPSYMFSARYSLSPFDRSPQNGFRLVQYLDGDPGASLTAPLKRAQRDFLTARPVSDEVFDVFRRQYSPIKSPLNSRVEAVDKAGAEWARERITFDAGYGSERVTTYLFLPRQSDRPHQVVVLWGGVGPFFVPGASVPLSGGRGSEFDLIDVVVKSGRAVAWPVWKGSFERYDGYARLTGEDYLRTYRERINHWRQDLARTIDYVQSRPDIDPEKVAYLAHSFVGPPLPLLALEERIRAAILLAGGMPTREVPPEGDPGTICHAPRFPCF